MSRTPKKALAWADVEKGVTREIWLSDIAPLLESWPENIFAGIDRKYRDRQVFIAILRILWENHPLRKPLGGGYPGVHPIHTMLHFWTKEGCLRKMWSAYLGGLSESELEAWADRFNAPNSRWMKARRRTSWYVPLSRELRRHLKKAGITVAPAVPKPRRSRRSGGLGDIFAGGL
jgi:hypothetical protein